MVNEFLLESFLTHYCYLSALIPDTDNHNMFAELADVFCLEYEEELSAYRWLLLDPRFFHMRDKNSFERYCRILEFGTISDQHVELSEREKRVLCAKRTALGALHDLMPSGASTNENVQRALYEAAAKGDLYAMTARSYFEYHGIGVPKDPLSAKRRIAAAARWNDLFANLMGLVYDPENCKTYHNRLYTMKLGGGNTVFSTATAYRGLTAIPYRDAKAALLDAAFSMQIVKPQSYDRGVARIIFGCLVSDKDKEKLLFAGKQMLLSLARLPFEAKETPCCFDFATAGQLQSQRSAECDRVLRNLTVLSENPRFAKPLFLQCADGYGANLYTDFLQRGFEGAPLYTVDAKTLCERDFSRGEENILLRALSETRSTRALLLVTSAEELSSDAVKEFADLADRKVRERFCLSSPLVSVDLSGVHFIFLAQGRHAAMQPLFGQCDVVSIAPCTLAEKQALLSQQFDDCKTRFDREQMQWEDACREMLLQFDTEKAGQILDGAFELALYRNRDTITLSMAKEIMEEKRITSQKREFGYTGGNYETD